MSEAILREVADRVAVLRERIAQAAARAGRDASEVTLVGASKRQPLDRLVAAARAGLREFGENYVQEAQAHREALARELGSEAAGELRWRLVGALQRNKAAAAIATFDRIDTVDRESLARALDARAAAAGQTIEVLVQVNISREAQKSGVLPDALPALLEACEKLPSLRVTGLMAIPAPQPTPEGSRPEFARLRELRDSLRERPGGASLHELSMGMSADFEVAIEEGATLVRVGTALFGAREG